MNQILQFILIIGTMLFFCIIINMIMQKKLELKYALTWLGASFLFIILSLFPSLVKITSSILHIQEPVNALFLLVLFFILLIIFTLTVALSRSTNRVTSLVQEIGLLKLELEKLKKEIRGEEN